jgi:ABC-type phosphate/phosphonate transport system substrate-binding protein
MCDFSELKMEVNKFMESSSNRHRSVVVVVRADSNMKNISEMEGKKACFPVMEGIGKCNSQISS